MPKTIKARKTCCLASDPEGYHKPKSAIYSCTCGNEFEGLKAWNEHMTARSLLRKRDLGERLGLAAGVTS